MKRTTISTALLCCFLVVFLFSGVAAQTTVKNVTVRTDVSLCQALYSLSSAATLLLPLMVVLAAIALISFFAKQNNVGFLFFAAAVVLYTAFIFWYSSETKNQSQYNLLSALLKEQGISFKKRDVTIQVTPALTCYITLTIGIAGIASSFPSIKNTATRYRLKRELEPYAYITPHLLFFVVFFFVPAIYGIYAAFTKWDLYNEPVFAGLSNFYTLLFDPANSYYKQLRNGLWNTIQFVLYSVPLCILVPLSVAVAMRSVKQGSKLFQSIYYLPSLMSASTVMLSWEYFFRRTYGMMNNFFLSTADWFTPPYTWVMLVVVTVWWTNGTNMVIYQSALAGIPMEQYEAANIDGANAWKKFLYVTLPGMRYPMTYTLVTTLIAQFNVYAQPDMLLKYSNSGANAVLLMYIRDTAFGQGVAGIASSMALILGLIIMVIAFFQIRLMRDKAAA